MAESSIQTFENDFDKYKLSPLHDGKTCPVCHDLSEQVFEIKDRQAGTNFPPLHPWCRCNYEIVVDDWDEWLDNYEKRHGSGEIQKGIDLAEKIQYTQGDKLDKLLPIFKTNRAYIQPDGTFDLEAAKGDYDSFIDSVSEKLAVVLRYAFNLTPFTEKDIKGIVFGYYP